MCPGHSGGFAMKSAVRFLCALLLLAPLSVGAAERNKAELSKKAEAILKTTCYRCHGQEGAVEGGMNFILDIDKLVQRKKVLPGTADKSPLYRRVLNNRMPPADEQPRPSDADKAILK